ncbi:modifier of mdg4-like [Sitodiplosis mosellana]|uniref:modifier of mdg4-like n=1 Tax=Sitodiplosis mosellana TaxID=263140 RepID=UPI0024441B06|nr:modifier of mdg4-like [Sitodiplosis mosellana]
MAVVIKFKDRKADDFVNKQIIEVFRNCEDPDVDLMVANGQIVSSHRVVLSMYSKYFRRALSQSNAEYKFIVPLIAFPLLAIQHVVELFYYGEIRVLANIKSQVIKALDFLEVDYDIPSTRRTPIQSTNMQVIFNAAAANQKIASQVNVVGTNPVLMQNKSNPVQMQNKPNLAQKPMAKPKATEQPDQSGNLTPTENSAALAGTEKPKITSDVQVKSSTDGPLDKNAMPLSLQTNSLTMPKPSQAEALQTSQNVESTPSLATEKSPENMPISNDLSKGACKPTAEDEMVIDNENIAARLLTYDVDKATEQIHSQVDEFMKEMDIEMKDVNENTDDMDYEV